MAKDYKNQVLVIAMWSINMSVSISTSITGVILSIQLFYFMLHIPLTISTCIFTVGMGVLYLSYFASKHLWCAGGVRCIYRCEIFLSFNQTVKHHSWNDIMWISSYHITAHHTTTYICIYIHGTMWYECHESYWNICGFFSDI